MVPDLFIRLITIQINLYKIEMNYHYNLFSLSISTTVSTAINITINVLIERNNIQRLVDIIFRQRGFFLLQPVWLFPLSLRQQQSRWRTFGCGLGKKDKDQFYRGLCKFFCVPWQLC